MAQRKNDKTFKEQPVAKIPVGETTRGLMAKELGVHYSTVRDWVKEYEKDGANAFPGSGNLKSEDEEIRRLCREVANPKEENEMLRLFS
ncbi:MAG: transposase [Clostridiaceae bacterium]